ncbi:hypothetical protein RIR_jg9147.t1 [Rhizophagus irregularis DAOM 181602=DAOM 197198]|nr:hypothetical protein RIR_jg9147.t1 [Rhizophagus irregularis DAOM 181602=DAOM 197198]
MIRIIILKLLIVKRYHFDTVFNGLDDELTTALRNYDYMCRSIEIELIISFNYFTVAYFSIRIHNLKLLIKRNFLTNFFMV